MVLISFRDVSASRLFVHLPYTYIKDARFPEHIFVCRESYEKRLLFFFFRAHRATIWMGLLTLQRRRWQQLQWGNNAAIFTPRVWLSVFHNKVREVFRVLLISYVLRVNLLLSVPFTHTDKPRYNEFITTEIDSLYAIIRYKYAHIRRTVVLTILFFV